MKSILKSNYGRRISAFGNMNARFSNILFNSIKDKHNLDDEDIDYKGKRQKKLFGDTIKNTELYKSNTSKKKETIKLFYKTKYTLKKRIFSKYLDSETNYHIMIINNILSNKMSSIKEKYTEMLIEIDTIELISRFVLKRDVYYFLKYLVVVYDKFHIQYPNYLKNKKVYYFMSKYIYIKQKFIDRLNESNKQVYMKTNMKKFFSDNDFNESKIISSRISESESEEEIVKLKQIRGQGFDVDVENSQDSLDKLQNLVENLDKEPEIPIYKRILSRARSKTIKSANVFLFKYPNDEKSKQIKWASLYEINNKKIMRSKKRKKTEIKLQRKKVSIEGVDDNHKGKIKFRKKTRKNIENKKNEINEIKRLFLLNDIGKNNKVLDIMKRGFIFIDEKDNKDKKKLDKKIFKNFSNKNNKEIKNKKEKEKKIIEKTFYQNKKINNLNNKFYNNENYLLFKNMNYVMNNLNNNLKEYRFYNSINNNFEKQKYYERKVKTGLFNDKSNSLFNSQNLNSQNEKRNKNSTLFPSIDTVTPSRKTYNTSTETYCKKLTKLNNSLLENKTKKNNLFLPYYNRRNTYNNEYFYDSIMSDKEVENSKFIICQKERFENNIKLYLKSKKRNKNAPLNNYNLNYLNKNNSKNKTDEKSNINNILLTSNEISNNKLSKKKIKSEVKRNKHYIIVNLLNKRNNNDNLFHNYNNFKIKNKSNKIIKDEKIGTLFNNINNTSINNKIKFPIALKTKINKIFLKLK